MENAIHPNISKKQSNKLTSKQTYTQTSNR